MLINHQSEERDREEEETEGGRRREKERELGQRRQNESCSLSNEVFSIVSMTSNE